MRDRIVILARTHLTTAGYILGLGMLLAIIGWWDLNHLGGFHWDTDEGTALMQVRMLQEGYALYRDVWSDHPPGLMLSILAAFRLAGSSVAVGRAVVVGFSLLGLLAVALIVRRVTGRLGSLAAAALLASAPNFFWLSRSVNRDIAAVCLATLGVAVGFHYLETGRRHWLTVVGGIFALGLWVKLIVVILLLPLAVMVLLQHWGSLRAWRGLIGDLALLALSVGLTLLPILLLFDPASFFAQVLGTPWQARGAWPSRTFEYIIWMWEYLAQENLGLSALAAYGLLTLAGGKGVTTVGVAALCLGVLGWCLTEALTHASVLSVDPFASDRAWNEERSGALDWLAEHVADEDERVIYGPSHYLAKWRYERVGSLKPVPSSLTNWYEFEEFVWEREARYVVLVPDMVNELTLDVIPGDYVFGVGLYLLETGERLGAIGPQGWLPENRVLLKGVEVR